MSNSLRIRCHGPREAQSEGEYVLYWMTSARRTFDNFALDRALSRAKKWKLPLVVLEGIRLEHTWSSPRLHHFAFQGMRDQARAFEKAKVAYVAHVERTPGSAKGLLRKLTQRARWVVTDEFPSYFLPRQLESVLDQAELPFEVVDSNGILPLRAAPKAFPTAYSLRRFLQKNLPEHLSDFPHPSPLNSPPPSAQGLDLDEVLSHPDVLSEEELVAESLDFDPKAFPHPTPLAELPGGSKAALRCLDVFLDSGLGRYSDDRNHPDQSAASGLSPYLHWGHISAHTVLRRVFESRDFTPDQLGPETKGKRRGWWGMDADAESFLDELITWRELGYLAAHHDPDFESYEGLPEWAQVTLEEHQEDERPWTYSLEEFAQSKTHDEIWNAAQTELRTLGTMQNYLRMLWGKKVLHWSESPRQAFEILVELNNRYALDGRNPNSYSGITWVLGRFDRAWGPEREVFGKIRYMTSDSTRRKLRLKQYLERFGS